MPVIAPSDKVTAAKAARQAEFAPMLTRILCGLFPKNDLQWLRRVNARVELLAQSRLGLGRQTTGIGFVARQLRERSQFRLKILGRNAIPITILEQEHIDLLLFDSENLSVWQPHYDRFGPHVDRKFLSQIKPGLNRKRAVQLYVLRTAGPGVL
jgi:hypothetical protein